MDECLSEETGKYPVAETAKLIERKWTILILRELLGGKKRFNEILKSLKGISPKVLSTRLIELGENGIINRDAYLEVPMRVEYSLTEKGQDLKDPIAGLAEWWVEWEYMLLEFTNNEEITNLQGCYPGCPITGEEKCLLEETGKCPVVETAKLIEKKWTISILREFINGKKRFNEVLKSLEGISPRVLSDRLREMEESGIINRKAYAEIPLRVEYALTEKGQDLENAIASMAEWWMEWNGE